MLSEGFLWNLPAWLAFAAAVFVVSRRIPVATRKMKQPSRIEPYFSNDLKVLEIMDASKEIARCRRDAEAHEWTAKELRCRADALESRDSAYVKRRQEEGIPVEPEPPWLQRIGDFLGIEL